MISVDDSCKKEESIKKNIKIKQFDVLWVKLPVVEESEHIQKGVHPAIVISNNMACEHSPNVTIIPLSSKVNRKPLPTHLYFNLEAAKRFGLYKPTVVKAEDMMPLSKGLIISKVGHISDANVIDGIKRIINVNLGNLY